MKVDSVAACLGDLELPAAPKTHKNKLSSLSLPSSSISCHESLLGEACILCWCLPEQLQARAAGTSSRLCKGINICVHAQSVIRRTSYKIICKAARCSLLICAGDMT